MIKEAVPDLRILPTSKPMHPSTIIHGRQSQTLAAQHLPLRCPHHPQPVHDHLGLPGPRQLHPQKGSTPLHPFSLSLCTTTTSCSARPATSPSGSKTAAGPNFKKQVNQAFRLVFNRPPNEEEMEISESVLEEENLFVLCRSLINSNEFFYFD